VLYIIYIYYILLSAFVIQYCIYSMSVVFFAFSAFHMVIGLLSINIVIEFLLLLLILFQYTSICIVHAVLFICFIFIKHYFKY